jgi:hypothetical protein
LKDFIIILFSDLFYRNNAFGTCLRSESLVEIADLVYGHNIEDPIGFDESFVSSLAKCKNRQQDYHCCQNGSFYVDFIFQIIISNLQLQSKHVKLLGSIGPFTPFVLFSGFPGGVDITHSAF